MARLIIGAIAQVSPGDHNMVVTVNGPVGMFGPYVVEQYEESKILRAVPLEEWMRQYKQRTDFSVVIGMGRNPQDQSRLFPARRIPQKEDATESVRLPTSEVVEVQGPYFQVYDRDETLIAVEPCKPHNANLSRVAFVWVARH